MNATDNPAASAAGIDATAAPHAAPADSVLAALSVDPQAGLSADEAARRLARHGPNTLRQRKRASAFTVLLSQFNSPVVYLLMAAAALAIALGEIVEFVAIAIVLVINAAIGFFTELQAVRSMEALRELATRTAVVRRGGRTASLSAETLVPGDIVLLDAGDVIAADMRIVSAANLAVDESALTGESLPVAKSPDPVGADTPLADRTSMLFKGSAITGGTGEAVVTGTGMATQLGHITRLVDEAEPERSPLEHQLSRLSRDLIWVTLAITAIVAVAGIAAGKDITLMIESAVALAVAAIPEGLPIVATLALARGMLRMARHNALIEQLSAVETLGAATVILTDKTGTLTENRMHVDRIVTAEGEFTYDRHAGQFLFGGKPASPSPGDTLHALLLNAALCNNASLGGDDAPATGDPMEVSLLEVADAAGLRRPDLLHDCPEIAEHAFDVASRMMATVHRHGDECFVAVKGAPEAVLDCVDTVMEGTRAVPFDHRRRDHWQTVAGVLASQGLRLLAIAGKPMGGAGEDVYRGLALYGLVGFQDPPRADIATAIADARRAGISVIMVTGDHAATARHISQTVGLSGDGDTAVEGKDLKAVAELDEARKAELRRARVFSRVDPEQKLSLIALHQEAGEVVAMTGDGVNDAPALRKADIGVAMGLRGTQVAREAADLILRDDAFSTIIHAVREGRMIYTNIRRFATYLLSCNLSEILILGLAVLGGLPLPLLPLQILFLNLVTDVFPAFALGTIEADGNVLDRPPRPPSEPVLARKQWTAVAFHGVSIAAATLAALALALYEFGLTGDQTTTMCFYTLALAQLWHVFNMRNWRENLLTSRVTRNAYVWMALLLCVAILVVAHLQPTIAGALQLTALPADAWYAVAALSIAPLIVGEVVVLTTRLRRPR
ncbi:MAG: cation-transporting P-type ATPase [Brucellaceae bacterium]|nr:cation-transporting P-type ATPase [Brucellaceae bacterium]